MNDVELRSLYGLATTLRSDWSKFQDKKLSDSLLRLLNEYEVLNAGESVKQEQERSKNRAVRGSRTSNRKAK